MHQSLNRSSFNELRQRIEDIKKRNSILMKKFKRSELKNPINNNVKQTNKRKILDDIEISAVENCYEKAVKLSEHYVKLKKARKQQSKHLQSHDKSFSVSNVTGESNINKKCQKHKTNSLISQSNFADESFNKQFIVTRIENKTVTALNEEIFIDSDSLTSTPNKHCINKRKNIPDELHPTYSCQKIMHLKRTLKNSDFNKNSKNIPNSNTIELIEGNNVNSDIIFLQSICSVKKKRNTEKSDTQNKSKINGEIKKLKSKRSKSNNLQIALNHNGNKSYDEASPNSDISLKTTNFSKKLTDENQPKENTKFHKKSSSNLVKIPLATSHKEFEHQTTVTKNVAKRTLRKPVKFAAQDFDVIKDTDKTIMTKLDLTVKHGQIEKNIVSLNSTENLGKAIAPEIDLTEEPVETVIPEFDLTEDPVAVIIPGVNLIEEYIEEIIPELTLTQNSAEENIPEVDLTEEYGEEIIPEFDLTCESEESILPELDFTEEPVDFPIPELHMDELTGAPSKKIQFLKSKGIVIRSGAWFKKEKELLQRNFRDFQTQFGIYDTHLLLGIGRMLPIYKHECSQIKKFLKAKHFYVRLGKDINDRTLNSIYIKARQMFNSYKKREDITPEESTAVIELQKKHGNRWNLIGQKLGISPLDCKGIYYHNETYKKGKWSTYEINNLISGIKTVTNKSYLNAENIEGISWKRVAEFVPTRNYLQCYREWHDNQSKLSKNVSYEKWDRSHAAKLILLLKNKYPVTVEKDILWPEVQKFFTNVTHSEKALRAKWYEMKRFVPEKFKTNFQKMIDFCYRKYQKYVPNSMKEINEIK